MMTHSLEIATPIPVLLYHRIASCPEDRFAVSPDLFERHVSVLLSHGRAPMTIGELAAALRGQAVLPDAPVAITFDDGFDDTLAAVNRLGERGLRATVYVTTGWLDRSRGLSVPHLRELAAMGDSVEIGAHTVSHPRLDELSPARVAVELESSKATLEDLLGRPVTGFAYPYGCYDRRVRSAVVEAGYTSAAAVENAISHRGVDPWAVARYTVTNRTAPELVARLLEGSGAPYARGHARIRTRAYRAFRRTRRRLLLRAAP